MAHEVIEAFLDPDINLWAYDPKDGFFHAIEACDPVQSQAYGLRVSGGSARVSNFVTPAWFDAENPRGTRFDYLRKLTDPFELVKPGGYTTKNEADPKDVEVFGFEGELPVEKKHHAARTSRRVAMESVRRRKAKYGRKHRG